MNFKKNIAGIITVVFAAAVICIVLYIFIIMPVSRTYSTTVSDESMGRSVLTDSNE